MYIFSSLIFLFILISTARIAYFFNTTFNFINEKQLKFNHAPNSFLENSTPKYLGYPAIWFSFIIPAQATHIYIYILAWWKCKITATMYFFIFLDLRNVQYIHCVKQLQQKSIFISRFTVPNTNLYFASFKHLYETVNYKLPGVGINKTTEV